MQFSAVSAARLAAFDILKRVEQGAFASILLARTQPELQPKDRGLTQELVLGVLRWQLFLDALISHYARRDIERLDPAVLVALRLGLYQLRFLTRIPHSAAVNESVKLVRRARLRSAEAFVNAVLRGATREPDYNPSSTVSDPIQRLSIATSHPIWLLERWIQSIGSERASQFAAANNVAPSVAFRVVNSIASSEGVLDELTGTGAHITRAAIAKSACVCQGSASALVNLANAGKVYIQDEASQLVCEVVNPQSGEFILDVCAAPGSKATLMADLSAQATVVACDLNFSRLRSVVQTAKLHNMPNIHCLVLNGLERLPFTEDSFDAVLVDAPCSGTGTLRRNPEIRWRITPADIRELASAQQQLLGWAANVVKPGGRLIYSTCSVEPEENEEVVQAFVSTHGDFQPDEIKSNPSLNTAAHTLRTWPDRDGTDGFFVAQMKRIGGRGS